jgi:hypothetical protein
MSPFAGEPGLCAVVPDANLTASVAETCNVVAGLAVPTPFQYYIGKVSFLYGSFHVLS